MSRPRSSCSDLPPTFWGLLVEEGVAVFVIHGEEDFGDAAQDVLAFLEAVAEVVDDFAATKDSPELEGEEARFERVADERDVFADFIGLNGGPIRVPWGAKDEGGTGADFGRRFAGNLEEMTSGAPGAYREDKGVVLGECRRLEDAEIGELDGGVRLSSVRQVTISSLSSGTGRKMPILPDFGARVCMVRCSSVNLVREV